MVKVKRIYDAPAASDGKRILVDRLWPRGLKKEEAAIDEWLKEVAPSTELREWFGHKPERFKEFRERYLGELKSNEAAKQLRTQSGTKTLLYAAKDQEHNHALVLQEFLEK